MNIVLFRGHMPPSAQGAVLGAAKLWLLIRPHVTSAPPGGWWRVMVGKTELFEGFAGHK